MDNKRTEYITIRRGTLAQFVAFLDEWRYNNRETSPLWWVGPSQRSKPYDAMTWWWIHVKQECRRPNYTEETEEIDVFGEIERWSGRGSITAFETPRGIKIAFELRGFPSPNLFWQTVEEWLVEMDRLGFTELIAEKQTTNAVFIKKDTGDAVESKKKYEYGLIVEATLDELNRCLEEFHSEHAERYWEYGSMPTIGETLTTRLNVYTYGESRDRYGCTLDSQTWFVYGLDVVGSVEGDENFCSIYAQRMQGWVAGNLDKVLEVEFRPEILLNYPLPFYSSYHEYLTLLLEEFQRRGMIEQLPEWAKAEPIEPTPAQDTEGDGGFAMNTMIGAIQTTCDRMGWKLELVSKPSDTFAEYKATLPSGVGGILAEFCIYVDPLTPGQELGMIGDNLINSFEPKADIFEKAIREAVRQALPVERDPAYGAKQEKASEPTPAQDGEGGVGEKESSSEFELDSLRRQLDAKKENLLLIRERLSEYVLGTDRPLPLVKEERRLQKHIEELKRRIAERAGK